MAFTRRLYCDYFGSNRFLHFSPLLSFSLVTARVSAGGKKLSSPWAVRDLTRPTLFPMMVLIAVYKATYVLQEVVYVDGLD